MESNEAGIELVIESVEVKWIEVGEGAVGEVYPFGPGRHATLRVHVRPQGIGEHGVSPTLTHCSAAAFYFDVYEPGATAGILARWHAWCSGEGGPRERPRYVVPVTRA